MDDSSDGAGDGAWLTYAEMANQCGISLRAAVRRTQRQRLRRQPGNDGKVRVLVPRDMLEPSQRASQDKVRSDRAGDARDALRTAIEALKGENAAQTSLIAELRIGLEQARAESQEAREALAELRRADDARKALGRWARLRRAWRGSDDRGRAAYGPPVQDSSGRGKDNPAGGILPPEGGQEKPPTGRLPGGPGPGPG